MKMMHLIHALYNPKRVILFVVFPVLSIGAFLSAQTISEKKASLTTHGSDLDKESQAILNQVNSQLEDRKERLRELYEKAQALYVAEASEAEFRPVLEEIWEVKNSIDMLEKQWRNKNALSAAQESYALWHLPDTTVEQLMMEYGIQDYIYLIPPEIAEMKISVNSNLPIPKGSWSEMLETILAQSGVGIKQINPYLRELVLINKDLSAVEHITSDREELLVYPRDTRIAFVLTPDVTDVRRLYLFIEKFSNPDNTFIQLIGRDILIVAQVGTIQEILKLYDFALNSQGGGNKDYLFVALTKIDAEEMAQILTSIFSNPAPQGQRKISKDGAEVSRAQPAEEPVGLKVVTLSDNAHALFLLGTPEELCKAEEIIDEVQCQLGGVKEKTIFWYTAKHSEPEELARVLGKVYALLTCDVYAEEMEDEDFCPISDDETGGVPFYAGGYAIVNPAPIVPSAQEERPLQTEGHNFIVDPKTGSIVMVVETQLLPRLKELLKKLDVPKKMVHIDVLLFEKSIVDRNQFGLNLLRIGSNASNTRRTSLDWNDTEASPQNAGILDFMISRMRGGGMPAYDLVYKFLLTQDDVQINASPSITTVNQTPATIALVEEISINTGIVELDTTQTTRLKDSFARAQYGITIKITPTIHFCEPDGDDEAQFITLDTDITFDTVQTSDLGRPDVTRRHIKNEVRVANGETLILGGLKRLNTNDSKDSIPFLGEIPGLGKFFSITSLVDTSTEMFVFITPRIIEDNSEMMEQMRCEELSRRPGDTPEFMQCLFDGMECSRKRLFEGGIRMLFGNFDEG